MRKETKSYLHSLLPKLVKEHKKLENEYYRDYKGEYITLKLKCIELIKQRKCINDLDKKLNNLKRNFFKDELKYKEKILDQLLEKENIINDIRAITTDFNKLTLP